MYKVRKLALILLLSILGVAVLNQAVLAADDDEGKKKKTPAHTQASLKAAVLYGSNASLPYQTNPSKVSKPRSIGAAVGFSALVPGLGQAYNRHWVKAVAAFALEAAVITGAIVWRNQGNDLEFEYQQYAHAFWDPAKYANWLNDYSTFIVNNYDAEVSASSIVVPSQINFRTPQSWSDQEWDVVLDFFQQIRTMERQMFHVETLAAFSHTLPDFSEQQYYELVGKYYQFAPGWEDYPVWRNGEEFTEAIDPNMTGPNDTKPNVSSRFFQYADDHAHANNVLRRASRITTLLIATHFIAAIEAGVSAKLHNDRLKPSMEIGVNSRGEVRPVASLKFRF